MRAVRFGEDVAHEHDDFADDEFGDRARVGKGRIEDGNAALAGRGNVDLIHADAEAADRHELRRGGQHVGGDLRARADADDMRLRQRLAQVLAVERPGQALDIREAGGREQVDGGFVDAFEQQYAKVLAVGDDGVDHGVSFVRGQAARRRAPNRRRHQGGLKMRCAASWSAAAAQGRGLLAAAGHEGVEGGPELRADRVGLLQHLVPCARQEDHAAGLQPVGEARDGRDRNDMVVRADDDQDRRAGAARQFGVGQLARNAQRRVDPAYGWASDRKLRRSLDDRRIARVAARVGGEVVALEGLGHAGASRYAGRIGGAQADRVGDLDDDARRRMPRPAGDLDHGRDEYEPFERRAPGIGLRQQHRARHRMGEREPGLRAEELQHLLAQRLQIALEHVEIVDMALVGVGQFARRKSLAAPVHGDDGKAALDEFADRLEIFLDELAPPGEDADGPQRFLAERFRPRRPARDAQQRAVLRADGGNQRA